MKKVLLLALATVLFASGAFAAEDDARFALVIGNAAYDGDAALANSANDASDMAEALSSVGWKVTKLINGDRKAMNKTLASFRDAMMGSKNPTALLFYAGHGVQIGGQNYLLPIKETFESPDDVTNDAMSLQAILNAFDDAKVLTNIVILDACRDNPFVKKNTRSLGGTRGLSVVNKSANVEGSAVLFATAPGDTAADGNGRNGVFTQALLKYIKTDLSLQVLATKVTGEVKKITGGKQTPYSSLSLSDEFFIVPASLRTPAPEAPILNVATPTPAPIVTAPSSVTPSNDVKATLIAQKTVLTVKRQSVLKENNSAGPLLGLAGWGMTALGAGATGYGFWQAKSAQDAYAVEAAKSIPSQKAFDDATAQASLMNLVFKIGAGVWGVGLATVVGSLFTGPDTSAIDKQIADIDKTLTLLGAN